MTLAAEAVAARLRQAGYPAEDVQVVGPNEKKRNLVARLRGTGARRPVLFLAHLDVVEARREDWSVDPYTLLERDGFFYGRGTSDDKDGAAILAATFIRLKQENYRSDRDLILALTADEDGGNFNGVSWLLESRRSLIDAEFCINADAGDGQLQAGRRKALTVETSEKSFYTVYLDVKNPGGHSSLPVKENAIYRLAAGLTRLAQLDFPPRLNQTTKKYFETMAAIETGQLAEDMKTIARNPAEPAALGRLSASPYYNAILRTTCVATQLAAGRAENALPQSARAVVNCRLLPDEDPAAVERRVRSALADDQIAVTPARRIRPSPDSPLLPDVLSAVERAAGAVWPGVPIVPVMETGGTDGRQLRQAGITTYGSSGVFLDVDDIRMHGKDERILVESFYQALEYQYHLAKALSQ